MHLNEHNNNTHNTETNCAIVASRQSLPIYKHKDEIISTLSNTNYLIITGETGSGKTTQLPQYIIEHYVIPRNSANNSNNTSQQIKVVITQPRRVAAIQMAKRVAYEQQTRLGTAVGYTIRFDDYSNKDTQI
jgi:HrpA-like RNA helicase